MPSLVPDVDGRHEAYNNKLMTLHHAYTDPHDDHDDHNALLLACVDFVHHASWADRLSQRCEAEARVGHVDV